MKTSSKKTVTKRTKPINPQALAALCQGVEQLVKGQLSFAEGFGLNPNRVFPGSADVLQHAEITGQLQQWLRNGKSDVEQIQRLFADLMQHQLALLEALDGVAVKALQANNSKHWLQKKLLAKSAVPQLMNDASKRFQQLITPGFIKAYVHSREKTS